MKTEQEIQEKLKYYLNYMLQEPMDADSVRTKIAMLQWVLNDEK